LKKILLLLFLLPAFAKGQIIITFADNGFYFVKVNGAEVRKFVKDSSCIVCKSAIYHTNKYLPNYLAVNFLTFTFVIK